jgi:hypothetical protein
MAGNGAISIGIAAKAIREQKIPARLGGTATPYMQAECCLSCDLDINKILVITPSEGGQCVALVLGRINT